MKKKKNLKIGFYLITAIILVIGLFLIINFLNLNIPSIKIINDEIKLNEYNNNLEDIRKNLDLVASSSEDGKMGWYILKTDDEEKKDLYYILVYYIKVYYLMATGNGENALGDGYSYSNSNFLKNFDNKEKISKKEFQKLMSSYKLYNDSSIENFENYEFGLPDGYNDNLDDLKNALKNLSNYYKEIKDKEFKNYEEVLDTELKKSSLVKDFSSYIVEKLS